MSIMTDFGKKLDKSTRLMKEESETYSPPSLSKKSIKDKISVQKNEEQSLPSNSPAPSTQSEDLRPENQEEINQPNREDLAEEDANFAPQESRDFNQNRIGICQTYLGYCRGADIMFKYGTAINPRTHAADQQVVKCVALMKNCLDQAEEISFQQEQEILNTYRNENGAQ